MILVYAFSNRWGTNVSRRTLLELEKLIPRSDTINYQPVFSHPQSFYQKYIKGSRYQLILGLGDGFHSQTKIRIETSARNLYCRSSIIPFAPISLEISLPLLDFVDTSVFSVSENMGSYHCNWLAFQTQYYLGHYSPATKHLFLHLPPRGLSPRLAENIAVLLKNNRMLK